MPYLSAIAGAVYCHNAVSRRINIQWPKKDRDMYFKQIQKQNILQSLLDNSALHALSMSKQVFIYIYIL